MKATLNLDQHADLDKVPEEYLSKLQFVPQAGTDDLLAIYPQGTEFEGAHAIHLVRTGQASPSDDECAKACGMSPAQIAIKGRLYAAHNAGIKGKADIAMFMAGAITGYGPGTTDENPVYIHGPNWDAYQTALAAKQAASVGEI